MNDLFAAWEREVPPPSQLVAGLPTGLDELVLSLLQHDPLARPAGAAYVIDRLGAIANLPMEEDTQRVSASYVAYPPLVGRGEEMRELEHRLSESAQGRGQALWIEAAQGAGRSALLDQLALQAQLGGATVLRAQGGVQGSALSLARGLAGSALRTHPDLRRYCEQAHPSMTAFCLSARDERRPHAQELQTPASAAEAYAELMSGMQDCLLELSRLNPLVLVIDDVQRADAESAGLLASLAHEAHDNSLLVIVSAASDEPTRGPPALAKLRELSHVTTLPALGEAHVAELITAIFGAVPNATRLARWLYAQSEGSPRRAMDLLRLLLQRRVVRYQGGLFSLPYDVGSEVGAIELERVPSARLEALGADAHRLAQQLSIEDDATQLEASGRAFSKPRAALLRMCHFGFRGEQEAADKERGKAEVLALLGGTSWSAMSAMAIRQLLMYQWTRDSVGLLRVLEELQNLIVIAPALETHRALGTAYLELLRGRPQRAP